jgi:hypothetical protein
MAGSFAKPTFDKMLTSAKWPGPDMRLIGRNGRHKKQPALLVEFVEIKRQLDLGAALGRQVHRHVRSRLRCPSAADACGVSRLVWMRPNQQLVSSRIGPQSWPSFMSPAG